MSIRSTMKSRFAALSVVLAASCLSACAPLAKGVSGYDNFLSQTSATVLKGPESAAVAAKCFENNARFLPLSEFSRDSAEGSFTYRLRVAGVWYEQVVIAPDSTGSRAEMRLSPALDARWQADFSRDRAAVAARCLSPAISG